MDPAVSPNEPAPSRRSLYGPDGLNFLTADVRDGLGPYLSVFLKGSQGWQPGDIGVVSALVAADLMRGTGRFNLAQGLVALAFGVKAGLSNVASGYVVQAFGYPAGFLSLAAVAAAALVFFWIFVPGTSDAGRLRPVPEHFSKPTSPTCSRFFFCSARTSL